MRGSSRSVKGDDDKDGLESRPSKTPEDAHKSSSEGSTGSARDRDRKERFVRVPRKPVQRSPSDLYASGDVSWQGAGQDSKPDPPPSTPPETDKPSDPRDPSKKRILPRSRRTEAKGTSTRSEAVATAVASLRGTQTMESASVETRGSGCVLIFSLLTVSLLAWLMVNPAIAVPGIALTFSALFLAYALKYYVSVGQVLRWSNGPNGNGTNGLGHSDLTSEIKRHPSMRPFISIHLPLYNEPVVVDRLLQACTSLDYPNYEVIVADDSTDETTQIIKARWASHPKVKLSHRENRTGFKGGALNQALTLTDPKAEFIAVFDADFIPPPDILYQFLAYYYGRNGTNGGFSGKTSLVDERLAAVQGYQWHVLNASENWITRGVRTEYSGSYVIERSSQELGQALKMIAGSVFMIRADVLKKFGWGTSITEDWELTLNLYLAGYKVLYSPFVQAPAECVADFHQLARQRMRWAEGHTYNVKKFFFRVLTSTKMSLREKLEFLYYVPYYLQSLFFLVGTGMWLVSELVLKSHLPFWSAIMGWSLVFTNAAALILVNLTGLFIERGLSRNWSGLFSFVLLSFMLAPYQAYASAKALFEPREGDWHRTQKTGVITEMIERLDFGKRLRRLLPKKTRQGSDLSKRFGVHASRLIQRLPLPAQKVLRRAGLGQVLAAAFLIVVLILGFFTRFILTAYAAPDNFYLRDSTINGASPAGEDLSNNQGSSVDTMLFDDASDEAYWYTELTYPSGASDASIAAGDYTFYMHFDQLPPASPHYQETSVSSFTTTSDTFVNVTGGSLVFTPAASSDIWVILISARLGSSSSSQTATEARFTVNSVEKGMGGVQNYTSSSRSSWQDFFRVTNTTAQQTVQVQLRHANEFTATIEDLKIIAFKMPDNADFQYAEDIDIETVTGGSWNSNQDLTFTPSSQGDYLIMAVANYHEYPSTDNIGVRIVDPSSTTWPEDTNGGSDMLGHFENGRVTWCTAFVARVQNLTATEKTFSIEGYGDDPDEGEIRNTRIMAFRMDAFDSVQSDEDPSQSSTTSTSPVVKSTVTTAAPPASRDYIIIQSVALKATGSSTEERRAGFEADDAVQTSHNHVTNNDATYVSYGFFDAVTTSSSVKYENTYSSSDSGYTVYSKESAIHVLRFPAASAPAVFITVSVHHTDSDGSDATLIVSNSTTINSATADPLEFSLGSGALQTFQSTDVQRLRIHIDVTGIASDGSFTLAYDSAADPARLSTPAMTVADISLIFMLMVAFIPVLMAMAMEKRRMVTRLVMIAISMIMVIAILGSQVLTALAAPDYFYLRDTTTNGASPAGEDMSIFQGSSEDTMVFDDASDEAYWYTETTYPTGGDDAVLPAGSYSLEMFFDSLPSGSSTIQVDDANHNTTVGGSSITIPHATSGTQRLMVVGVSINPQNDEYVTGITWNGTENLVQLREDQNVNDARTEIWYLVNPTATSSNVVVSFNDSLYYAAIAGVVTYTGVDQSSPFRDDNGGEWDSTSNPSVSVTSAVGDMIFGVVCVEDRDVTGTTADTEHWRENEVGGPSSGTTSSGGTKAGEASSTSIAWTFTGADHTTASAASIKPAPASVDIVVSVYHTNSTGGDATEIITSSAVTIDSNTTDPYELTIGSGAQHTFQASDPRRLRVHIDVTGVNNGSFTLAYDSVDGRTNLNTPTMTVADISLLFLALVAFIPLVMGLGMKKRRLATRLAMIALSLISIIAIMGSQIIPVFAAPDNFYLRDTTNNGASPAGEDMNDTQGSSENTKVFNDTGDDVYWYSEDTWPTGGDDASIAAGNYSFHMYFDSLPGPGTITIADVDYDYTEGGDSITIPHNPSGSNLLMVVGVSIAPQNDEYVTGVTWNGTEDLDNLRVDLNGNDARSEIWYLVDPTATSANVVVTLNASLNSAAIAGVVTFTGVDQSSSFRDDNGNNWDSISNPSVSVTSAVGDMIFGVASVENQDVTGTNADTEHWRENQLGNPSNAATGSGGTKAGAATSTSISWTFSDADHTAVSAVSIVPAASVGITVSVHHTDSDGSDATLIISNSATITTDTADPYVFSLGSGAEQTFQSTDVQRLRLHVDVTSVSSGGSFTLAYDSAANPSYLATPVITVPEASFLMILVVFFIPIYINMAQRRRRAPQRWLAKSYWKQVRINRDKR